MEVGDSEGRADEGEWAISFGVSLGAFLFVISLLAFPAQHPSSQAPGHSFQILPRLSLC